MSDEPDADELQEGRAALKFCNSFSRLDRLRELHAALSLEAWLTLLGEEWQSCDNIASHREWLLLESDLATAIDEPAYRAYLMTPEEREALAALPDEVEIWRGCYENNKDGLSWSLRREIAESFPTLHRYQQDGQALIIQAKLKRSEIIALKLDRDEAEIIAHRPNHVSKADIC